MFDYKHIFTERGHLYNLASQQHPAARETERALMIDRLKLGAGLTICDAPAGGGYLANGIAAMYPDMDLICVDPSERFAAGVNPRFRRVVASLDKISLADASIDRLGSLAGLHHLTSKPAFYREAYRILKTGGILAVADVQVDTPNARFLNGPVDRYSETGHDGVFLAPGELTRDLAECGFEVIEERLCHYTWNFPDERAMAQYCKGLFGMTKIDEDGALKLIRDGLGFETDETGAHMAWSLVYAAAVKV